MAVADLIGQWEQACARSDALFARVTPEGLFSRPIGERHRLLFYRGHLEAFDFNTLRAPGAASGDAALDVLFARGIDPTNGHLPQDTPSDWPRPMQIERYAQHTRQALRAALDRQTGGAAWSHTLQMLIEHRWMHIETLTYMLHQMPPQHVNMPMAESKPAPSPIAAPAMRHITAGPITLGQRSTGGAFGWDNEFEAHTRAVDAFDIDTFPVTNADFQNFVRADGYTARELWRPDDWDWICRQGRRHPLFWHADNARFRGIAFGQPHALLPDAPVFVSFAEAHAYATFCGKRLPTEAQWQRACTGSPDNYERLYPWGEDAPAEARGNFGGRHMLPGSVHAHPAGCSAWGVHDLLGNGWEWTRTPFAPFAGFAAHPDYPGYSADFFDAAHFVLKGASMVTQERMLRRSFRNWFQPRYPYIYAKFRCVRESA